MERRPPHPEADDDGGHERFFSGDDGGGHKRFFSDDDDDRTGASPAGSTPTTAGEGGWIWPSLFVSPFFFFFG
jgi:hypothetical protein